MRVLIISDIHANPWALRAVEKSAGTVDQVIFAGDAVNYGPDPASVVDWLRAHHVVGVRGNHDQAVAFAVDPKASPTKQPLALAMRDWTRDRLDAVQTGWLLTLPRRLTGQMDGATFMLVHGTPVDSLYDYRLSPDASEALIEQLTAGVKTDLLITGHTHLPLLRKHGEQLILNPGSVGQPLDGDPRAAYALWEDGKVELCRVEYDNFEVLEALRTLPLIREQIEELSDTLRLGRLAPQSPRQSTWK